MAVCLKFNGKNRTEKPMSISSFATQPTLDKRPKKKQRELSKKSKMGKCCRLHALRRPPNENRETII